MKPSRYLVFLIVVTFFGLTSVAPVKAATHHYPLNNRETTTLNRQDVPMDILPLEEEIRKRLKGYIANAEIGQLLHKLLSHIRPCSKFYNEICMFSFRYTRMQKQERNGLLKIEEATLLANQISFDILDLIDSIGLVDIGISWLM